MIFSAIHMFIRMMIEERADYSDTGLGFIIMGTAETLLWCLIGFVIYKMFIQ